MGRQSLTYVGCCLFALTAFHCKENTVGVEGSPSNVEFPASNVSYNTHVQQLFNQACSLPGCHDDGSHQSPLNLTSYGNTVLALPGVVVPNDPGNSGLVMRIEGSIGARMPLNRNPLNQNQINGIRTWIAEGARNN